MSNKNYCFQTCYLVTSQNTKYSTSLLKLWAHEQASQKSNCSSHWAHLICLKFTEKTGTNEHGGIIIAFCCLFVMGFLVIIVLVVSVDTWCDLFISRFLLLTKLLFTQESFQRPYSWIWRVRVMIVVNLCVGTLKFQAPLFLQSGVSPCYVPFLNFPCLFWWNR